MGTVDKIDMVLKSVECIRKSLKWYKKYFFYMLDMVVWNAYCLYQSSTATKLPFAKFHLNLMFRPSDGIYSTGQMNSDKNIFVSLHYDIVGGRRPLCVLFSIS
ncbi:hypothetical protein WH47_07820 [Habropoda laboriosa]|uniref:PiggyBac transposable element-derived protein domain-containing protein n=1 Tax=Habropoda laboriosa TaxID=597456 RepID=A0A0L7QJ47_9HYME|nr:hypothetical protein WH47_07820 [Habropoda laboriosa]